MFASNAEELKKLIAENPDYPPSSFLADDSFASACYDKRDLRWLHAAFNGDADLDDCEKWGLTRMEWKENVEMAFIVLKAINQTKKGTE
jgi:hypothetical protein